MIHAQGNRMINGKANSYLTAQAMSPLGLAQSASIEQEMAPNSLFKKPLKLLHLNTLPAMPVQYGKARNIICLAAVRCF